LLNLIFRISYWPKIDIETDTQTDIERGETERDREREIHKDREIDRYKKLNRNIKNNFLFFIFQDIP